MDKDLISHIPEKIKIQIKEIESKNNEIINMSEEEKNLIKINKEYLESKLWNWKKDETFEFILPPTIFKEKKIIRNAQEL